MFYNHRVAVGDPEQHALERYLKIADALGCGTEPVEFHFPTNDQDRSAVAQLLGDDRPYAVLLPGTNWATKRWPGKHFAALVEPLKQRFGLRTVLAGSKAEIELAAQVGGDSLNLAGQTTLRQLVALLEKASVVIANDSGPMHIASALNRPLVTMFGPTNPVRTGPYKRLDTVVHLEIICSPCYSRNCWHNSCMKWLAPELVLHQVADALAG